ncbi:hypothetical protein SEPCBS119000_004661 [Sporothrix epigloea]|uniref:Uncharacterized protein n=1 Tax=Sporothrix epigloea TaxID=1892477 RepID=A0ABP0DTC9_9PEZI
MATSNGAAVHPAKPSTVNLGRLQVPPVKHGLPARPVARPAKRAAPKLSDSHLLAGLSSDSKQIKSHPVAIRQALASAAEITLADIPQSPSPARDSSWLPSEPAVAAAAQRAINVSDDVCQPLRVRRNALRVDLSRDLCPFVENALLALLLNNPTATMSGNTTNDGSIAAKREATRLQEE